MTDSLYTTGIRPIIDKHLLALAAERRDYGQYWSASSAGYCMRKVTFDRLGVPEVNPDARKHRIFESGHVFHNWIQSVTRDAGISVAQEMELQDEELMVRGHFDDLVRLDDRLLLVDYKTVHSQSFKYKQGKPMSYFHRMQLGTYLHMLRKEKDVSEARIVLVSKDDLRLSEQQLLWDEQLDKDILTYWRALNRWWRAGKIPPCTCGQHEGGFMAREAYNPYFYGNKPCSMDWYRLCVKENKLIREK